MLASSLAQSSVLIMISTVLILIIISIIMAMSVKATWTYSDLLQRYCIFIIYLPAFVTWNIFSKRTTCDECRCDLEKDGSPTDLIVYTRMGTKYFNIRTRNAKIDFVRKPFSMVIVQNVG